ncbi:MAG: initiation factor 2B [Halobacteriota archaeon]
MADRLVVAFVRNRADVLLCRYGRDAPLAPGRWSGVSAMATTAADPAAIARTAVGQQVGLDDLRVVRTGAPVPAPDDAGRSDAVAVLLESTDRSVDLAPTMSRAEWTSPASILARPCVPGLWRSYETVAPSVRTIAADTTTGSTTLSVRALEVLRDRAAVLSAENAGAGGELVDLGRELRSVRPEMLAVKVRVARVLEGDLEPSAVRDRAERTIEAAAAADRLAARVAADAVDGAEAVLTFSRSGTVRRALEYASPRRVILTPAAPGGEGVAAAEALADELAVELVPDAAIAAAVEAADAVLVGADGVGPDGVVRNKVGTRTLAAVADHRGVPLYVATATAKCCDLSGPIEHVPAGELYDGAAQISVDTRRFESTPAAWVDGYCTERGVLDPEAVGAIAEANAALVGLD